MAKPTTASWSKFLVLVGDGASPEVFTAPCALTAKGIDIRADTSDSNVPDCDSPDLPSWVERTIRSMSGTVSGSGRLALGTASAMWRAWMLSGQAKNVRIKIDTVLADDGGYFAGSFLLTGFRLSGNETDGKIGVDVTLVSDGELTWVAASA